MQLPEPIASFNGLILPLKDVMVPALDRGFLFGDGVYEVIRLYQGRPFLLDKHLQRLEYSLKQIQIEHPISNVKQNLEQLLADSHPLDGYLYIQVTRGAAMRNHVFPEDAQPNELLYIAYQTDPLLKYRDSGISVITAEDIRWHRPDIKSVNLLPNVLLRQRAKEAGAQEAILVRWDNRVTEATSSNVFVVKNGVVLTPKNNQWILQGVSREFVFKLCMDHGIPVEEADLKKPDLFGSDELFLSSTFSEVIPVTCIDGRKIKLGPITQRLVGLFRQAIDVWLKQ